jgi:hypothetical protein
MAKASIGVLIESAEKFGKTDQSMTDAMKSCITVSCYNPAPRSYCAHGGQAGKRG